MNKLNAKGQTLKEFLNGYDRTEYVKPAVTADCLIFACGGKKVLCVKRGNHPCIGEWALPGGFCEKGESCEQTAVRELHEETGHSASGMRQLCFVSTPGRDPRDWIMSAVFTKTVDAPFAAAGGDDAADARWLDVSVTGEGATLRVTLSGDGINVYSDLNVVRGESGKIDFNKTKAANHGIAFDHAKIILYGLEDLL